MNASSTYYFKNLNALRFVAFLLVFLSHAVLSFNFVGNELLVDEFASFAHLGRIGVDFFFVLSSFLITYLIEQNYATRGSFSARNFLARRSLRIWPLYFLVVLIGYVLIIAKNISVADTHTNPSVWYFITFTINLYIAYAGNNFLFLLVFLWSIAIEEQFYLAWAFIMKYGKRKYPYVCIVLIIISLVFRYLHSADSLSLYFHTLSAVGNFAVGALVACLSFHKTEVFYWLQNLPKAALVGMYIMFASCLVFYTPIFDSDIAIVVERLVFSILAAFVIFEQSFCKHSFIKLGQFSALNYGGKISYGLYCYHGIILTILIQIPKRLAIHNTYLQMFFITPLVVFLFTLAVSILSYEYFEKPFLRLKRKFY